MKTDELITFLTPIYEKIKVEKLATLQHEIDSEMAKKIEGLANLGIITKAEANLMAKKFNINTLDLQIESMPKTTYRDPCR